MAGLAEAGNASTFGSHVHVQGAARHRAVGLGPWCPQVKVNMVRLGPVGKICRYFFAPGHG